VSEKVDVGESSVILLKRWVESDFGEERSNETPRCKKFDPRPPFALPFASPFAAFGRPSAVA
jgi:hypothetical protein